ncbi:MULTISPECIES: FecR family protein [Providencia]|uniref:FecR family protein n=1 Tax=Providencia TaxID=586 RepID=UPI001B36A192|nr:MULTISPECIES: FecR domain-containing protein [Providencia]MBQ0365542.1 FecR domain-containing protein [Providencia rettgeri]
MKPSDSPSEIENKAAMWVVKTTQRELTSQESEDFQCWLNASELHKSTYYRAQQLWALTANKPRQQTADNQQGMNKKRQPRYIGLSIAAVVLVSVLSMSIWYFQYTQPADYYAKTGEIQHITLPDGSRVDLDSGAQLQLAFSPQYRQVNLLRGRAYFTVAPKTDTEPRPFQVMAKNGITQALGTEFSVDNENSKVAVSVYQHSVKVSLLSGQEMVIPAGNFTQYQSDITPMTSMVNSHSAVWREGQIIFQQQTFPEVIAEINRYRDKQIILLTEERVGHISGVLQINTLDSGLTHLVSSYGLSVYEIPFFTLIY